MGIIVINAIVEAHHSIGVVEYYHRSLQQVYSIITTEIPRIKPDLAFQISFKAINNLVSPNELVLTLLVFSAHPKMTERKASFLPIGQSAIAM